MASSKPSNGTAGQQAGPRHLLSRGLLVLGGYVAAVFVAFAAVYVWDMLNPGRDVSSGMAAFGDALMFLAVLTVAAVPATCALLYFLRPYLWFWRVVSFASLTMAATGAAAAIAYFASHSAGPGSALYTWGAFAVLRILSAPGAALAFFLAGLFAPDRGSRILLFVATSIEAVAFGVVVASWLPIFQPH